MFFQNLLEYLEWFAKYWLVKFPIGKPPFFRNGIA